MPPTAIARSVCDATRVTPAHNGPVIRSYDAAVVGAGPAGGFAAYHLARRGASVLLLERRRIPRAKPCGGGLTPKAYRQLDFPIDDLVCARPHAVLLRLRPRDGGPR